MNPAYKNVLDWETWLTNELLNNRSKQNATAIAHIAATEPLLVEAIFSCAEKGTDKLDWRSAWVLDHLNQFAPEVVFPYLNRMILFLPSTKNDSIRRTYLKILGQQKIPEIHSGVLMDECFKLLQNPQSAIAVRVWCMNILVNFSIKYPEIKSELTPLLELVLQTGSGGEKSRARNMLKTLDKES